MSTNTASNSNANTEDLTKMVKNMSEQMETLLGRVEKLDKADRTMQTRLKKIEKSASESGHAASLVAFDDFDKAFSESRRSIATPQRLANLSSPVRMTVSYQPSEEVVSKVLSRLEHRFASTAQENGEAVRYENRVNELVAQHGLATELREVTKKMNLYRVSPLRKTIYAKGYAWALFSLFETYQDRISKMIEDTYGFTQKVISQLESEDNGPVTYFAEQSVELTMSRNKLCGDELLTKQVALSLRDKI